MKEYREMQHVPINPFRFVKVEEVFPKNASRLVRQYVQELLLPRQSRSAFYGYGMGL